MRSSILFILLLAGGFTKAQTSNTVEGQPPNTIYACKLTSSEVAQRKATVIASLKQQVIQKKELSNGFAYSFPATDALLDEISEFIKTERACCDFFTFNLLVGGNKPEIWLEVTGPEGAKDFITIELDL